MPRSFRIQLAISFALGVACVVAVLTAAQSTMASRAALRAQADELQTLARSTATVLADGLDERMREVELLTGSPVWLSSSSWRATLEQLQRSRPHFSWIALTSPNGQVLAATGDMLAGANVAQRPWFQAAMQGPYTGDVHAAVLLAKLLPPSVSGEPVRFVDFAAPIRTNQGEVMAVLGVHMNWDWAHDVINSLRSPLARQEGVRVFILDRQGEVIHRPLDVSAADQTVDTAQLTPQARILTWADGGRYLTAGVRLRGEGGPTDLGWTIVTRQPVDEALANARQARRVMLALGLLCVLLATAWAWWMAARLSRPLERIARAARALQAGELDTRIPRAAGTRETENLSQALQDMTQSLIGRERALAEANATLERRVAERTAELTHASTALQEANQRLRELAHRDTLTGLPNRRSLDNTLLGEMRRHARTGQPLSLALADIDHFKAVNDTHGHGTGDEVLRRVAQALGTGCRSTDVVGRLGGEEFLVIMPDTPLEGARRVCEKLRTRVAGMNGPVPVRISFGLVSPAQAFATAAAALEAADQALYLAKAQGRDRVCVYGQTTARDALASGFGELDDKAS